MDYDKIRSRASQVAERMLEKPPCTPTKEKLIEAFIEGAQWAKMQPSDQPKLLPEEVQQIQALVVRYLGLECYDIWEKTRRSYIVKARRWVWYWWRKKFGTPFLQMSKDCGYDHSSIIAGIKAIEEGLQIYLDVKRCYIELKALMDSIA